MGRHLSDGRLLDCYLNERDETTIDPRVAEHLTDCEPCGARYAELTRVMDTVRSEAELETDAIFTPERLRLQQEQIARRIEHANRSGRVITFPAPLAGRTMTVSAARTAPRWIAAALLPVSSSASRSARRIDGAACRGPASRATP